MFGLKNFVARNLLIKTSARTLGYWDNVTMAPPDPILGFPLFFNN
jgi:hypothetical protein